MKFFTYILFIVIATFTYVEADENNPTKDEVAKLYVATFNRAPDSTGLDYWVNNSNLKLSQIAKSFFEQDETISLYPYNMTDGDFITAVYQNLFNRKPKIEGFIYWKYKLSNGEISKNNFILAVINGAKDNDKGMDATILENKKTVGLYFAKSNLDDVDNARYIMKKVTQNTTSLTSIFKDIDDKKFLEESKQVTIIDTTNKDIKTNTTVNIDETNTTLSWYKPITNTTWHWQLSGNIKTDIDVNIYDIDMVENHTNTIKEIQSHDKKVMCYFSAGSWENFREDKDDFPSEVIGNIVNGWANEKWLDIRSDVVREIMKKRIELAYEKGCDGIEPDNIDGYTNNSGFNLTYQDQINFNKFLAEEVHKKGMFIALKNDINQVNDLVQYFDLQINEQCFEYNECDKLKPFIDANKPVLNAEYNTKYLDSYEMTKLCNKANKLNFKTLVLPLKLDNSFRHSCDTYLYKQTAVGFGGSNSFKFHDNIWLNSANLVLNDLDKDYYKGITDYNLSKFQNISTYLKKSKYIIYWITKGWKESWFSIPKIQSLIDAGYIPVFNYWYFGDKLMDGLDSDLDAYYKDVKKVKTLLAQLDGTKMLILEPEFNKKNILNNPTNFIDVMRTAIDIVDDKQTLISLCMTDTGSRSVDATYAKCGYENCSLGDKYEWGRPERIYKTLLNRLDFISFQEMVGQFSRNPSDAGTWDKPKPIRYTDAKIGIDNLAKRIDNFALFLKDKYNKPVFLPYITIATATWADDNNDSIIDANEINSTGWEDKANLVYTELNSTNLFGYAPMALFDDPNHDAGGYKFFMQNEYHLGIIKSDILEGQLTGNISTKKTILENIFR